MDLRSRIRVVSLFFSLLTIGWVFTLVFFGRVHTGFIRVGVTDGLEPIYAINFLPFWVFVLGAPAVGVMIYWHTAKRNLIVGVITGIALSTTAVALGGCLAVTVATVHTATTDPIFTVVLTYGAIGLTGELVAMLSLMGMVGILPYLSKEHSDN